MQKLEKLQKILKELDSAVLAFSGGVDSSFLLKVAKDCLGNKILAVTADSATYPKSELEFSIKLAGKLRARHRVIKTVELANKKFSANPVNRCYFCKQELFSRLKKIAEEEKLNFVIDASSISDKDDFRPGTKARKELGVRSPLEEAGFTKADIRNLSKRLGLTTWNKPAAACLASRIPYGRKISVQILKRINQAETFLSKLGVKQVRVRDYGNFCRIETLPQEIPLLISRRKLVVKKLKQLRFKYITLDLEGYRTGSLNEEIRI